MRARFAFRFVCLASLCLFAWAARPAPAAGGKGEAKSKPEAKPADAPAKEAPAKEGDAKKGGADPKADEVLAKTRKRMEAAKAFSLDAVMTNNMQFQGMNMNSKVDYKIAFERPNRFSLVAKGDGAGAGGMGMPMEMTVVCDGEKLWRYMPIVKSYTEEPAPKGIDGIVFGGADPMGIDAMLFSIISSQESEFSIMQAVQQREYIGQEKLEGADCHHLRFSADPAQIKGGGDPPPGVPPGVKLAIDAWIESGEQPFVRKVVPDIAGMIKAMAAGDGAPKIAADGDQNGPDVAAMMKDMKMELSFVYSNWKLDAKPEEGAFKFTPPEGAKQTDNLMKALAAAGGGGSDDQGPGESPSALEGKPAPTFKLDLAGGGQFDLAEQKGKKIVILDFWATWCGPCRKAMPVIIGVAEALKGKDVVLVAVNLEESAGKVKEFLEKEKLHPTVALDKDGAVAALYKADAIPQTVIIGKDGVVAKVHVGLLPNLKEELTAELEKLIGK